MFEIKDSGTRMQFPSGMERDVDETKIDYTQVLYGPMFERWAEHLTKAKAKYPDAGPGTPNWTLAAGMDELVRFKVSAFRHMIKWMFDNTDEDHAAAVFFNINGAEYVKQKGVRGDGKTTSMADILSGRISHR